MTDWTDETLRPLGELARMAFPEGSGVTADTLKRRARQGKLIVYRPGRAFVSTLVNVRAMIEATRARPAAEQQSPAVPDGLGLSESELANLRLDRVLKGLMEEAAEKKRIQREEDEWLGKYNARKAARKPPRSRT
jgi:hypothetical protein